MYYNVQIFLLAFICVVFEWEKRTKKAIILHADVGFQTKPRGKRRVSFH